MPDEEIDKRVTFGYFDGKDVTFFQRHLTGEIAKEPAGTNGWDWDKIFIPDGYDITRAQMTDEQYRKTTMELRPLEELKEFLLAQT